jgi:hypothetical protein
MTIIQRDANRERREDAGCPKEAPEGAWGACFIFESLKLEQPTILIWGLKTALQGSE